MPTMTPIATAELAQMRTDVASAALDTSCTIWRAALTADGMLGSTEAWYKQTTVNVGLAEPTAGQLQNYDYVIGSLAAWQVKLPFATDVRVHDHLVLTGTTLQWALRVFGSTIQYSPIQTLVVQVVLEPRSYASLLTVLATEVK